MYIPTKFTKLILTNLIAIALLVPVAAIVSGEHSNVDPTGIAKSTHTPSLSGNAEYIEQIYGGSIGNSYTASGSIVGSQSVQISPDCELAGCNNELCVNAGTTETFSVCHFREEYSCYDSTDAVCEVQTGGQCGWSETTALTQCIANASGGLNSPAYYVATSGNDSTGDGSEASPWATFAHALTQISAGDTLYVKSGVYTERVRIPNAYSTSPANKIIIAKDPSSPTRPIIEYDTETLQALVIEESYVEVSGLEVDGLNSFGDTIADSFQCVLIQPSSTYDITGVVVDNLVVHNCTGMGIEVRGQYIDSTSYSATATIRGSEIYHASAITDPNASSGWASGIKLGLNAKDVLVQDNYAHGNYGEGIAITRAQGTTVIGNEFFNNFSANIYIDNSKDIYMAKNFSHCYEDTGNPATMPSGAILKSGSTANAIQTAEEVYDTGDWPQGNLRDIRIVNNIFSQCRRSFLKDASFGGVGLQNTLFAHNLFYSSHTQGYSAMYVDSQAGDSVTFRNNISVSAKSTIVDISDENTGNYDVDYNSWTGTMDGSLTIGTNAITPTQSQLAFSSASPSIPGDFSIRSGSAARDAGITLISQDAVVDDFVGAARDAAPDMGPFEFIP
jgi:parallel beta-helix repeat protein